MESPEGSLRHLMVWLSNDIPPVFVLSVRKRAIHFSAFVERSKIGEGEERGIPGRLVIILPIAPPWR
jgi:hypothetical protein